MLPEFDVLLPKSLDEALSYLANEGKTITPIAGGTNVVIDFRGGRHYSPKVMNIQMLSELRKQRSENGKITIGSGTTLSEILENDGIAGDGSSLKSAAALFANPLVRNRATVGGNIGDASPAADTVPPLLVLDAEVELVEKSGSRWVKLSDFFIGVRKTIRKPAELISAVRWDKPQSSSRQGYYKLGLRKADAISVVAIAVFIDRDRDGKCKEARIALGSVAPRPLRATEAEKVLKQSKMEPTAIKEAADLAAKACSPIDDLRASAGYRRQMVQVLVARLLTHISEKNQQD